MPIPHPLFRLQASDSSHFKEGSGSGSSGTLVHAGGLQGKQQGRGPTLQTSSLRTGGAEEEITLVSTNETGHSRGRGDGREWPELREIWNIEDFATGSQCLQEGASENLPGI